MGVMGVMGGDGLTGGSIETIRQEQGYLAAAFLILYTITTYHQKS
jgi:hypothetical protein